jgi:lipoprotein-releasing system ATP-binding protein
MTGRVTPLVEAVQLEKRYLDGPAVVRVLEGLELVVERGERIAIVGESGIGKSTLLHLLGALDRPTGGQVLFEGEDVFARSEAELATFRNRSVGFVFQFHHLLGDFTALENVMLPGMIARQPLPTVRARAAELLDRVGLGHRGTHRPGQLSGGEQQRVAVARALCLRPQLLLADEPTGNLDPATAEEVQALLLQLNTEHGSALIIATHNPKLANAMSRTLRLDGGRLHEETAWTPPTRRGGVGGASS